ncbi:MAG: hypothetical protein JOZ81_15520 [Chloroflexi bacterium]|nr:hypothetical protein [Chloroflexota bacterium]
MKHEWSDAPLGWIASATLARTRVQVGGPMASGRRYRNWSQQDEARRLNQSSHVGQVSASGSIGALRGVADASGSGLAITLTSASET